MAARFLGQFLLERGVVTAEGLLRGVAYQEGRNLKLGDLAVQEGFLTREAAEKINLEQRRTDSPFGVIAQSQGLLDAAKLERLLARQKQTRVMIGEALVAVGAIGREKLTAELAVYAEEQARERREIDLAKAAMPWAKGPVFAAALSVTSKLLVRVAGLMVKEGLAVAIAEELKPSDLLVSIKFTGDWRGDFVLGFSKATAERLAARMLGEPSAQPELVLDAVKEFANVAAGQICASLGAEKISCDLSAPQAHPAGKAVRFPGRQVTLFSLDVPEGSVQLGVVPAAAK